MEIEIAIDDPRWIPEDDPRWVAAPKTMPKIGTIVIAILQHWYTKGKRQTELKAVDEDDCNFRTADDDSEISYDWTVTHWMEK